MFVSGMIAHSYSDVRYAHYSRDFYKANSNNIVGSITKFLRDLECSKPLSTKQLFENTGRSPLFSALLEGKEACMLALGIFGVQSETTRLPPVSNVQLDNNWKDNKSRFVFCYSSLLVAYGDFK